MREQAAAEIFVPYFASDNLPQSIKLFTENEVEKGSCVLLVSYAVAHFGFRRRMPLRGYS
jgi:hypothetical protein